MTSKILLILTSLAVTNAASKNSYLWNLADDPYEDDNLYDNSDYSAMKYYLKSQLESAVSDDTIICDGDATNTLPAAAEAAYEACGGVCPYLNNTYEMDIEQIYFPEDPPHIVFMLADDWGFNDVGFQSTYMNWTTPNIDSFKDEGIRMTNYFTHYYCVPSRGALMTGRTANRLGQIVETGQYCELPLTEVTMAQEMKSAGYRTYMVGKWDLGSSSLARTPEYRGYDSYYGYYTGLIDYYTKIGDAGYVDLQNGDTLETDTYALADTTHTGYLFQSKVETVIQDHATNYPDTPMFLYYALQLIHYPYDVPTIYSDRCGVTATDDMDDDYQSELERYCGLTIMLDEVIANTTCVLESTGLADSAYVILASDNGGISTIPGNSVPYKGHKFDLGRGGVSAHAFIFSKLLSESLRGTTYSGLMHVSDWLPTLMMLATEGDWTGSYSGATLDGVSQWKSIMSGDDSSSRSTIVHYAYYEETTTGCIQYGDWKLDFNVTLSEEDYPTQVSEENNDTYISCSDPSYDASASSILLARSSSSFDGLTSQLSSGMLFILSVLSISALTLTLYSMVQNKSASYQPIDDHVRDTVHGNKILVDISAVH